MKKCKCCCYEEGFKDAKEKAARLVWDTIGTVEDTGIVFHVGSTALGNAIQEIEEEEND